MPILQLRLFQTHHNTRARQSPLSPGFIGLRRNGADGDSEFKYRRTDPTLDNTGFGLRIDKLASVLQICCFL
ncbi:MAG: hypothetical protein Q8Q81_18545 [Oxalobacteraceae bacterium]|nr:hypothetical protein [Oxalobacteraceae bacterium]